MNALSQLENFKMSATRVSSYPAFLKPEFYSQYTAALRHYLTIKDNFSSFSTKDIKDESFIFWLAVVAYSTRNLTPLITLDKHINLLSDTYYWLYLAHEPSFFYSTVEIEMYRRRISYSLSLFLITETSFRYMRGKEANILHLEEEEKYTPKEVYSSQEYSSSQEEYFSPCELLSHNTRLSRLNHVQAPEHIKQRTEKLYLLNRKTHSYSCDSNWSYYGNRIKQLCSAIIRAGGIIAGGFVNSLVNPTFFLVELTPPAQSDPPYWHNVIIEEKGVHYSCKQLRNCRNLTKESLSTNDIHDMYPGLCDCIRAYFAKQYEKYKLKLNLTLYQQSVLEQDVKIYQDYDLEAALIKYKDRLLVKEGKLYFLEFHYSQDIDVFFTGKDYPSKCSVVMNLLMEAFADLYHKHINVRCDTYVTTFSCRKDFPSIQLIKRAYNTEEEILAGFDLHSCRVALLFKEGDEMILAPDAYITAVNYGLNLITPSCQSASFNFRLSKYYTRAFEVYLPGGILDRFKLRYYIRRENINSNSNRKYKHMLKDFLLYRNEYIPWSKECHDYDQPLEEDNLLRTDLEYETGNKITFPLDIREREIRNCGLMPQIRDVLYLGNRVIEKFGDGRNDSGWQGPSVEYANIVIQYMISLFWKTLDANTQFTGSFNPSKVDYLFSLEKEIFPVKKEGDFMEESLVLSRYLPECLVPLVLEYFDPLADIYILLLEVEAYLDLKSVEHSFAEIMLAYLAGRGITIK
jgi:hypothetical protein